MCYLLTFCYRPQQPPHNFSGSCFGKIFAKSYLLGLCYSPYLFRNPISKQSCYFFDDSSPGGSSSCKTTKATIASPFTSWGRPTTAASATLGELLEQILFPLCPDCGPTRQEHHRFVPLSRNSRLKSRLAPSPAR